MLPRKNPDDYDYKPLRQGDLDGLCGVYAVLNALQWLVPEAQDPDFLTKLFDRMMGSIININHVRDGGEEPEIQVVHAFVAEVAKKKFKVNFNRIPRDSDAKAFKTPDLAMEAKFKEKERGVFVFGFEGLDSHFRITLFDSWEYPYFDRGCETPDAVEDHEPTHCKFAARETAVIRDRLSAQRVPHKKAPDPELPDQGPTQTTQLRQYADSRRGTNDGQLCQTAC
jgi:hypothetical protein